MAFLNGLFLAVVTFDLFENGHSISLVTRSRFDAIIIKLFAKIITFFLFGGGSL